MNKEELKAIEQAKKLLGNATPFNMPPSKYNMLETLLNLIEKQKKEIENIKKEVQEHIAFENRLKRDGLEPDLFNQGRFYVANNIKDILDGREII